MGHTALTWYSVGAWKKPLWYSLTYGTLLDDVLAKMENKNIGIYCFEAGCVEPGCDNCDVPLRKILDKLEK